MSCFKQNCKKKLNITKIVAIYNSDKYQLFIFFSTFIFYPEHLLIIEKYENIVGPLKYETIN